MSDSVMQEIEDILENRPKMPMEEIRPAPRALMTMSKKLAEAI
jgi:hypothetical protein